ncbi:hypothetical protein TNCV_4289611 [Trichonephila clavipes]|nr:hypothetical protein TNCV_4289611 [Trichonephila clavipes]
MHWPFNFRNSQTARVYGRHCEGYTWMVSQKSSNRASCKGQLALTVSGREIIEVYCTVPEKPENISSDYNHLNNGANRTVSKRNVQRSLHRMGFVSHRPLRVPLLNARLPGLHVLPGQESTEIGCRGL